MNWLQRLAQFDDKFRNLTEEVFIDDSGFVYGADGDIGPDDHDTTVLNSVLGVLDDFEELEMLDVMSLSEEQMRIVDSHYPGFVEFVAGDGLPKEYAVLHMGWIRVLGSTFEIGSVTDEALSRVADYAHESTGGNPDVSLEIADRSRNSLVSITLGELDEAVKVGQGTAKIYALSRRPQGLY